MVYTVDLLGDANLRVRDLTITRNTYLANVVVDASADLNSVTTVGNTTTNSIEITSAQASTSKLTGALKVTGGMGVQGNVHVGSNLFVESNLEVGTANLFVDTQNGNVGIGTTDPSATLHVNGDVAISSNLAVSGSKFTYDNTNTTIFTGTNASVVASEIGYLDMSTSSSSNNIRVKIFIQYTQSGAQGEAEYSYYIRPNSANTSSIYDYINKGGPITPVVYRTDATELWTGGTPGVVRFGYSIITAQFVNWRVEVTQRSNNVTFYPTNTGLAVDGTGLVQVTPAPSTNFNSNLAVNTNTLFVDTTTGNVGIGTTDPDSELHIYQDNTSAEQLILQNDNQSGRCGLSMVTGTGTGQAFKIQHVGGPTASSNAGIIENFSTVNGGIGFYAKGDGDYGFRTTDSNTLRMVIKNDGKVGVGAFTPSYKFHVDGEAKFSSIGVNANPGDESMRVYNNGQSAAYFEATHSLGLRSVVRAAPSTGTGYNTSGDYGNNAVYRSDIDTGSSGNWKHFSAVLGGTLVFHVTRDGTCSGANFLNKGFDFKLGTGDQTSRGDSGLSRALVKNTGEVLQINYADDFEGGVYVQGSFSKDSGSFRIDHPLPEMTDTHHLVHSFIEGPQADNIYRGVAQLTDGSTVVNIDEASRMTEGTFVALNRRTQCFTTNETDWDQVRGTLNGNILTIECQNPMSTANVSWMVIGERQDKHMFDTRWTDDEGRVITEPLKDFDFDDTDYLVALRDVSDK
jgi:hypothetical protein